ncbi:MAG: hypothetical protein B7C24_03705 [Bacteroidetes bacterium 4572_77]|nr:MAG: hypothetical protein B7C24_03705 [Bacteroidetes bacterium 4572_77]
MVIKLKYLLVYLWLISAILQQVHAQLPLPEQFCTHFKNSNLESKTFQISYDLQDKYNVNFYHLKLHAETDNTYLQGSVEMHAQTEAILDTLILELSSSFSVDSVYVNQILHDDYILINDILKIIPATVIPANTAFSTEVFYSGVAPEIAEKRGYNSANTYHNTRANWTLSEPFYAKDWWPCKQDLKDKADSVWVFVSTNKKNKVGSNGLLKNTIPLPNNKLRYEWKSQYPIAYYLISIALAQYMEYNFWVEPENGDKVWMQNYLYADSAMYKSQKALIDCTRIQMSLLSEKYGSYPFAKEKYGHCITPIGGGMEHQTMTTQQNFNWHLSIHEMGHSWFGNHITCATWNHIWINEGFATYTQYIGLESMMDLGNAQAFMAAMQGVVMREPGGSVYVPDKDLEDRDRIFSGRLSYYKGAVIIHMIRYLLNDDDLFFEILQEFQNRYAYSTATAEDFKQVLEELSDQDWNNFFDLWYYGEGYPIYNFSWNQRINYDVSLKALQESSVSGKSFFPMEYNVKFFFEDKTDSLIKVNQDEAEKDFSFKFNKKVKAIVANPYAWNLMDVQQMNPYLLKHFQLVIEPNPAHNEVLIRMANYQESRKLELFNSSMQLVQIFNAENSVNRIELSHLSSGIYFLRIKAKESYALQKVIVL